jgi:hypothetical protein
MKKLTLFTALFFLSGSLLAQDCSKFIYMQKGRVIEETTYSDGKAVKKSDATVLAVANINGMETSTVIMGPPDAKPKDKITVTFRCNGGILLMDLSFGGGSSDNMKMNYVEYLPSMKAGDHLKDVSNPFSMAMEGKTYKGTQKISDRLVLAKESITTTAGTFSCFKISYKMTTSFITPIEGTIPPPKVDAFTEWYSPADGLIVKQLLEDGVTSEVTGIK